MIVKNEDNQVIDAFETVEFRLGAVLYSVAICPICDFLGQGQHFTKVVCRDSNQTLAPWHFPQLSEAKREKVLEIARRRLGIK